MTPGALLAAKRGERGLTIEQAAAATRIRPEYLRALEADDLDRFPARVYARGFLRGYARFLELDADELARDVPTGQRPELSISLPQNLRRKTLLTTPAVAAGAFVLLVSAFGGYAWRQITVNERAAIAPPTSSPAIQSKPVVVGVRVTDSVWISAVVDGNPQYGDSGRTLPAGSVVYFTGIDVKLTSAKGSATFITIDGRNLGPMGFGVVTREFSSQSSP